MTCARIISNMDKLLINTRTFKERKRGYTPKTEKYPENHTKDTVAQRIRQTLGPRDVWVYISALTVLRKSLSLCKKPRSNELLGSDWPQWYHWHKMCTCPWGMMFFYIDCEKQKRQCCLHIKCYQPNYIYLKNNYTRASCIIWPTV